MNKAQRKKEPFRIEICIDCGSEKIEEGQCQDCAETTGDILTPDGAVDKVAEIDTLKMD